MEWLPTEEQPEYQAHVTTYQLRDPEQETYGPQKRAPKAARGLPPSAYVDRLCVFPSTRATAAFRAEEGNDDGDVVVAAQGIGLVTKGLGCGRWGLLGKDLSNLFVGDEGMEAIGTEQKGVAPVTASALVPARSSV